MFKKITILLCLLLAMVIFFSCGDPVEPGFRFRSNINIHPKQDQDGLVHIKYKSKYYKVISNQIVLIIKENYDFNDILKKLKTLNYEITFSSEKYRSIIVQTDGKSNLLQHCIFLERQKYVKAVYPEEPSTLF
jgi:hypothetical protein